MQQGHGAITARKIASARGGKPPFTPGFIPIFPNNWHKHAFGYGSGDFSSLSPMQLGPAKDGCGNAAHNVENFYQFAKVYSDELTDELCECRGTDDSTFQYHFKPSGKFYANRDKAYADTVPHRHKKKGIKPEFSCYGNIHCNYVESRWFYCSEMERLLIPTEAFARLKKLYDEGKSIEIIGYDAYKPDGTDADTLYRHYCDERRPFGHEMVILSIIALGDDKESYPWNRYRREHENVYVIRRDVDEPSVKKQKSEPDKVS